MNGGKEILHQISLGDSKEFSLINHPNQGLPSESFNSLMTKLFDGQTNLSHPCILKKNEAQAVRDSGHCLQL